MLGGKRGSGDESFHHPIHRETGCRLEGTLAKAFVNTVSPQAFNLIRISQWIECLDQISVDAIHDVVDLRGSGGWTPDQWSGMGGRLRSHGHSRVPTLGRRDRPRPPRSLAGLPAGRRLMLRADADTHTVIWYLFADRRLSSKAVPAHERCHPNPDRPATSFASSGSDTAGRSTREPTLIVACGVSYLFGRSCRVFEVRIWPSAVTRVRPQTFAVAAMKRSAGSW